MEKALYHQEVYRNEIEEMDVLQAYNDMKIRKKYHYIMLRVNNDFKIVLSEIGPPCASFEDMLRHLPTYECRYVVFSSDIVLPDSNKLCFILWGPEQAAIRDKMMIASSKDTVKKNLVGISMEIGATDPLELDKEAVLERLQRYQR